MREFACKRVFRFASRQAGALAIAGLLAVPLFLTHGQQAATAGAGGAQSQVAGEARVVDGDTLVIGTIKVRLEGIDAPEIEQTCSRSVLGRWTIGTWKCGREAADHVARLARDRTVHCESRGNDAFGRMLGVCTVEGLEINGDLVRQGLAWAFVKYSQRYVAIESEARAAKVGIWQVDTMPAWEWRAQRWQSAEAEQRDSQAGACLIKGNITRSGQIYHMPWDRWYDKTRIEVAKGERWFCSASEAEAAGWRPAVAR